MPLLLVCKTGAISKKAGIELKKLGYLETNILSGGMISWYNSGLPFIK
jgi:rhodanese-related sulfurtransferase